MIQFSARTEYGMRCLLWLARQPEGKALSLAEIAQREHLPRPYAQQILTRLRRAGLLKSIRGTQGGFALPRPPHAITVGEVLRVLEGIPFQDTCAYFNRHADCGHLMSDCGIRPVWELIAKRVWDTLDHITLAHLISDEKTVERRLATEFPVLTYFESPRSAPAAT